MPFQFQWLCDLFEELQRNQYKKNLTIARARNHEHAIIYDWYQRFDKKIERSGPSAIAFLSCLLPERRPDRVYNLQANRLSQIFGRALGLGSGRALQLNQWRNQDGADFPICVELTLQSCENDDPAPGKEVTLEEIDEALELIAAHSLSSSPEIRAKATSATPTELLTSILRRLKSSEAKWLARMLLKSYAPIQIPEYQALHGFHFMLPNLLVIQNSFHAAITVLAKDEIRQLPARPTKEYEQALQPLLAKHVQPQLNVMIKRQPYHKARGIKNCCALASGRQMSVERKYDGEYCQIHVDMSKGLDCIKIFSKSGKESTMDRIRLHGAIKDALRIGRDGCRFRHQCIVEGELLVWSSSKQQIQPFHKIRRYVKHGGRTIGTAQDSPPRHDDQLMIAFYDILVLDDLMLLNKPHSVRRRYLKMALQTSGLEGRAILAERKIIDFKSRRANKKLREVFASAITQRWEGLVLKGSNDHYYSWGHQLYGIKLKKDYITGLGDVADLCVVGGRRDPHAEQLIGAGPLRWTLFYVGAVTNMEAVRRFDMKPQIKIIDTLTHHSMPMTELLDMNRLGRLWQVEYAAQIAEYEVEMGHRNMQNPTDLFKRPFIVEIMGAGFEKLSNSSYFTLRFPRKIDRNIKLHTDRTLLDTTSFSDLQRMAEGSLATPVDEDSQSDAHWIERLIQTDGRQPNSQSVSQATSSNKTLDSPSAIRTSPVNPRRHTSSQIFVRPDTEEPDTQNSSLPHSSISQEVDVGRDGMSGSTIGTSAEAKLKRGSRKRGSDTFVESRQSDSIEKRPCLQSLSCNNPRDKAGTIGSATRPAPWCSQEYYPAQRHTDSIEVVSVTQVHTKRSADHAEGSVPVSQETGSVLSAGNTSQSPPTPDSTLVMRQILSVYHRRDDLPAGSSPTKTKADRQHFSSSVNELLAFDCPPKTPFLPTPPTSSPAVEKRVTTIVEASKRTVQQIKINQTYHHPPELESVCHNMDPITSVQDQTTLALSSPASVSETMTAQTSAIQQQQALPKNPPPPPSPAPVLILAPTHHLLSLLPPVESTFTFSKNLFVRSLVACAKDHGTSPATDESHYRIVLVDHHNTAVVGEEFNYIMRALEESEDLRAVGTDLDSVLPMLEGRVLLFDHSVLDHDDVLEAGLSLKVLRKLHYGNGKGYDAHLFCGRVRFVKAEEEGEGEGAGAGRAIGLKLEYDLSWTWM